MVTWQPLRAVSVQLYEEPVTGWGTVIDAVVSPVDHRYVNPGGAVSVAEESPWHIEL